MFWKFASLSLSTTFAVFPAAAQDEMSLASLGSIYTCERSQKVKFDITAYTALSRNEQVIVDASWQQCNHNRQARLAGYEPDEQVVIIRNGENDDLSYAVIKVADFKMAHRNCARTGAVVGAVLSVYGGATGNAGVQAGGAAVQSYSGLSCEAVANALSQDNLLAVLAPQSVIAPAIAADSISGLLPFSSADERNIADTIKSAAPSVSVRDDGAVVGPGPGIDFSTPNPLEWRGGPGFSNSSPPR